MKMRQVAGTPTLRAALRAAQADAERLHGNGPVPAWRGPSLRVGWFVATAAGALLAAATWLWLPSAAPVGPAWQVAGQAPRLPDLAVQVTAAAPVAPPPRTVAAPQPADAGFAPPPAVPATSDEPPAPAPDADVRALHPDDALPVDAQGPPALGNRPDLPDEDDATPAEEMAAEEEPAGATPP